MIEIRCTCHWNYVELFWNSLDNAPSSIVFYLEMKGKVEVGVHDIRSRFTPRYTMTSLIVMNSNLIFKQNLATRRNKEVVLCLVQIDIHTYISAIYVYIYYLFV